MKKRLLFILLAAVVLAGCASAEESDVAQVVTASERAAETALNQNTSLVTESQYLATPLESGNIDPNMASRIVYVQVVKQHPFGFARLSNFQINSITFDSEMEQARVSYQLDVTLSADKQTETVTQDLLLVKTLNRGWRIAGSNGAETTTGDVGFLGNLVGQ